MTPIAVAILAALVLSTTLGVYLRRRQISNVLRHRSAPPSDFAATISPDEHRRSADYTAASVRLSSTKTLYDGACALVWLLVALAPTWTFVAHLVEPGLWRSVAFVLLFLAISEVLDLPFALAKTFGLDAGFGLNRQTLRGFFLDWVKSGILRLAVGAPLLFGMFWVLDAAPHYWWLVAYAGFMAFVFAVTALYPSLIAPLFNKFAPLQEDELRARLESLLARCGFAAKGLYVIDASRRSTRGNAYFAGLGKSKRIVLFDTLIAKHTPAEIESILAHELGHFKHGHIRQMMLMMALVLFAGFAVLYWALGPTGLAPAFGLPPEPAIGLAIALLAEEPIAHVLTPLFAWRSRRAEFEADDFAKAMVGEEPLITALTRLTRDNLATLTPDKFYAAFYYSHPPVPIRIAHLRDSA
jgi:STE24 endopeptidase